MTCFTVARQPNRWSPSALTRWPSSEAGSPRLSQFVARLTGRDAYGRPISQAWRHPGITQSALLSSRT